MFGVVIRNANKFQRGQKRVSCCMSSIETLVSDHSAAEPQPPSRLRDLDLASHYSHEDGDFVDLFFVLALSCSRPYRR